MKNQIKFMIDPYFVGPMTFYRVGKSVDSWFRFSLEKIHSYFGKLSMDLNIFVKNVKIQNLTDVFSR